MTSRLDRLFILLETGTNVATKRAAAQQLGEAQRLHPHDLHHLLARVSTLLKSSQWDTRISAAHAVQAILSQVPPWNPDPINKRDPDECNDVVRRKTSTKLKLENFDVSKVLARSTHLTGSEGSEYDLIIAEGEQLTGPDQKENLAIKLGFHPRLMNFTADLFDIEDFTSVQSPCTKNVTTIPVNETLKQSEGLSRREMNRAKRKARQSVSKQRSREPDDREDHANSTNVQSPDDTEPSVKKLLLDEIIASDTGSKSSSAYNEQASGVPDITGCWPDSVINWPLESFAESLCQDLFSQKWEIRHGAATALRELIRLHGKGAGKSRDQTLEEMKESHHRWITDAALRLLCVLGLDRFGDFVSDQVIAPVRETCAQALGSLLMLVPTQSQVDGTNNVFQGLLSVMMKLLEHYEWEARHGALLALKYLLAIRNDLLDEVLPKVFPSVIQGLADPVDDVGAAAASALIPVASALPRLFKPSELEAIVTRLWRLLKEQDDLAAACNSFMGLLAAILSLPTAQACLRPQPLSQVLPRLWPFLSHPSSSVRKATLQTMQTLTGDDRNRNKKERWGEHGAIGLQEALRHVYQCVLIEHIPAIQDVAERVWENLVVNSDLELLLHAACPLVSTWLCLAMQPEYVPFNPSLLVTVTSSVKNTKYNQTVTYSDGQSDSNDNSSNTNVNTKPLSELKIYIGGIETVAPNVRKANVVQARCRASRMLGLLSYYIVQPAPGVIYTPDVTSPTVCYANVLLAYLNSRSALQRTIAGLTMSYWANVDPLQQPMIPDILRERLLGCLNECVYYDEIANAFTRLLHESRDYIATLKHYGLPVLIEVDSSGVMTLDQIITVTEKNISTLCAMVPKTIPNASSPVGIKIKPKLNDELEERRQTLLTGASTTLTQQHILHVMSTSALAGAAAMLHCLPPSPQPLNPVVKPLMEAIKREENEELQKLAAKHLARLVDTCVDRKPSPNIKISTNLCAFLCSDVEFTPRVSGNIDADVIDGILTLNNRQKQAERLAYNRGTSGGLGSTRGPGRPPTTEIPLEELLSCEEPEAKAARTRRRGATFALTAIADFFGPQLPSRLPHLWELIMASLLKDVKNTEQENRVEEEGNQLIFGLQVLETIAPSLNKLILPPALDRLPHLCSLLAHPYKAVRHMAARCVATLAKLSTEKTMAHVIRSVIPMLETSGGEKKNPAGTVTPNKVDSVRQGAAEALACLVESLGVQVVPYAVLFMVPLLGRMSDQNQSVRWICSATFATLVQLLPLDPGAIADPPNLAQEKRQERLFLEQLLNPRTIPDTDLPVPVAAELRSYQRQGLNWLNFLNRFHLHGVLCDDMGLGKTLQTLCMLALDHYRNADAPPSLVVCPPTLTGHWVYEVERFFKTNDLTVIHFAGPPQEREKLRPIVMNYKLIVVSYDIVRKETEFFEGRQWNYCVLDEGHIIKNGKTKSAKAAKRLHANYRLILSGTPIQNNVLELWSLFDFLMPGFLGSEKQFAARYSRPILACREPKAGPKEQEAGALAMEALHKQVLPFLLRRNKEDVLQDLPPKITQDYYCDLSPLQRMLYEDFRTRHSAAFTSTTSTSSSSNDSHNSHVFEALRYLRNVCNHPKLVLDPRHPMYQAVCNIMKQQQNTLADIEHGAKLPALKQLLLDCGIGQQQNQQARGNSSTASTESTQQQQLVSQHRALIFCQLKAMLDIVEKDLLRMHLPTVTYLRLDGSIPAAQRHSVVTRFNADPSIDVLLLTTQVGGLGLNLTGADTVIFVEHDWNPMKDLQAMDRAHRIGQKKVVNVYRLITRSTVEEKIMGLQKFKLLTANTVISAENASLDTMGTDQLLDLFTLDNEKDKRSKRHHEDTAGLSGVSRSILDILPELWGEQQYEDEYDLDSFLSTLKADSQ
ncbi:TATA-binding protein-associated factor 172 [Odontomachus brunneus]|uniref:TATA-binding protein-associated factor 172 n=1 Tax=Odontomachus brunneus TaxID=486640 RepID=UPI0013F1C683|nr:TATA-binding protein-associated factor 172 [Odontomachus brunneus]XP_032679208.1 TATA-binding protein-associated factor 172 [Odontomachus brunneus]XP_032679209.1 TATA-binding protein-associated factor 172 [Odontomachus brunneus]XP_032679210.1 TATA-binding protein-associated factor 172 [Odontomachus brunneus]XP_032679211.1 TATA-binding protein-associated factor 172 [Odontomachus brunneus]